MQTDADVAALSGWFDGVSPGAYAVLGQFWRGLVPMVLPASLG